MLCLCYICINYYNYTTVLPPPARFTIAKVFYFISLLISEVLQNTLVFIFKAMLISLLLFLGCLCGRKNFTFLCFKPFHILKKCYISNTFCKKNNFLYTLKRCNFYNSNKKTAPRRLFYLFCMPHPRNKLTTMEEKDKEYKIF